MNNFTPYCVKNCTMSFLLMSPLHECCKWLFLWKVFLYQKNIYIKKENFYSHLTDLAFDFIILGWLLFLSTSLFESYIIAVFPVFYISQFFYCGTRYSSLLATIILLLCFKYYYIISVYALYVGN